MKGYQSISLLSKPIYLENYQGVQRHSSTFDCSSVPAKGSPRFRSFGPISVFLLYIHTDCEPSHHFISGDYPLHPKRFLLPTSSDTATKEKAMVSDTGLWQVQGMENGAAMGYTAADPGWTPSSAADFAPLGKHRNALHPSFPQTRSFNILKGSKMLTGHK